MGHNVSKSGLFGLAGPPVAHLQQVWRRNLLTLFGRVLETVELESSIHANQRHIRAGFSGLGEPVCPVWPMGNGCTKAGPRPRFFGFHGGKVPEIWLLRRGLRRECGGAALRKRHPKEKGDGKATAQSVRET